MKKQLKNFEDAVNEFDKEHDLKSPMKTIDEYAKIFKVDYNLKNKK